ncbi:MAG: response regulator [Verrucomicrobia bacterium]|nr:response regulator [Verrucomicrobiota bacterium]
MNTPTEPSEKPGPRRRILVVDDEAPIRELLQTYFQRHGYYVSTAATESEMFRQLKQFPAELIILDVLLQDSDGLDLLANLKRRRYRCPVIIITGLGADDELKRRALERGASECMSKSSPLDELRAVVERTLAAAQSANAAAARPKASPKGRRTHHAVSLKLPIKPAEGGEASSASQPASPRADLDSSDSTPSTHESGAAKDTRQTRPPTPTGEPSADEVAKPVQPANAIPATADAIARLATVTAEASRVEFGVEVFLRMLAAHHPNIANTSMRTVVLCKAIGERLQLPASQLQNLLWAAALQDVALVRLDKELLHRWQRGPDKCTKEEWNVIKRHPVQSQRLLEACPAFKEAGEIVAAHHENWDGSGYPDGLRMEMIPWLSRLLSVVTDYCSRHTPNEKAVREIEAQANQRYDPQAVQAFVQAAACTALPRGERELISSSLQPGMVLAADMVNWDGVLVLGQGTELSNSVITKVLHLSQAGHIEPRVLVCC